MSNNPKVSVVILNWNGENKIQRTIPSLKNIDYANYEVVFVDNNSSDQSVKIAEDLLSDINAEYKIVENESNEGYSRGKNIGADVATGEYLWLLDNDILVQSGVMTRMVELLKSDEKTAAASPVIKFIETDDQRFKGKYSIGQTYRYPFRQGYRLSDSLPMKSGILTTTLPGATLFIGRDIWDELGGYDESCEMKLDQHDLSMRIWISGYSCKIATENSVRHLGAPGGNVTDYKWYTKNYVKSRLIMILKNYQLLSMTFAIPMILIWIPMLVSKWCITDDSIEPIRGAAIALAEIVEDADSIVEKRKLVQANRIKPDSSFMSSR
jgi:GT2 family glycosyltransferase